MSRDVVDLPQMLTNIKGGGNFYILWLIGQNST